MRLFLGAITRFFDGYNRQFDGFTVATRHVDRHVRAAEIHAIAAECVPGIAAGLAGVRAVVLRPQERRRSCGQPRHRDDELDCG